MHALILRADFSKLLGCTFGEVLLQLLQMAGFVCLVTMNKGPNVAAALCMRSFPSLSFYNFLCTVHRLSVRHCRHQVCTAQSVEGDRSPAHIVAIQGVSYEMD